MKSLGQQIVVDYHKCNPELLNDVAAVKRAMREAALKAGATIVTEAFHLFNPYGVSGAIIIAESHLAIHTWPEFGYAAVDLFTCGDEVDPAVAFEHLKQALEAEEFTAMEMKRGIMNSHGLRFDSHKPTAMMTAAVA
ncbi:MAG: adenosylmethionine decarboxylase [Calditrichaeota bacterium]|nr:adenosylmethionine decarboxylase [Calditrichota bacterium]MCB9368650.1 adenosylmethionine decarboxylase [Calditrichota bacterium]